MASATVVITYTVPDLTGPVFTRKPVVTDVSLGGTAMASLSQADVNKLWYLLREANGKITVAELANGGIDPSLIT